jgi:hypothetical protein
VGKLQPEYVVTNLTFKPKSFIFWDLTPCSAMKVNITVSYPGRQNTKKVKLSLEQAVEAHRVVRRKG